RSVFSWRAQAVDAWDRARPFDREARGRSEPWFCFRRNTCRTRYDSQGLSSAGRKQSQLSSLSDPGTDTNKITSPVIQCVDCYWYRQLIHGTVIEHRSKLSIKKFEFSIVRVVLNSDSQHIRLPFLINLQLIWHASGRFCEINSLFRMSNLRRMKRVLELSIS